MSDPAASAAQRAWAELVGSDDHAAQLLADPVNRIAALVTAAAREALAPYRDRHRPLVRGPITVCKNCTGMDEDGVAEYVLWPCPDARDCYTTEELENQK